MTHLLTLIYVLSTVTLALYTLGQAFVLVQYLRHRKHTPTTPPLPKDLPYVVVQLPLYNEQAVIARLLGAVVALDYPHEKLTLQFLDDSTDDTTPTLARLIAPYISAGWDIQHIRRTQREGYKAGALAYGLTQTNAEFVAIFDADFMPPPHFLRATLPFLIEDEGLAMLQTRWGHLNAEANPLTSAQRLSMDAHFTIEQTGRSRGGLLVPFNGTGGVWRVRAIHESGGWSAQTLTEDCDLSYRAQLQGWRALYLPDVVVPGELPPQLAAYRQQQARWAQGNTECLKHHALPIWQSPLSLTQRVMALHHLAQYLPQVCMMFALLALPLLVAKDVPLTLAPLGFASLIPPLMYVISQSVLYQHVRHLWAFPVLALLTTGMIARNSWAVARAFLGLKGEFKRTPKFAQQWQASTYALPHLNILPEVVLLCYSLWGLGLAIQKSSPLLPYILLYVLAFGMVVTWEVRDHWQVTHPRSQSHWRTKEG